MRNINYVYLLDYAGGGVAIIQLTEEEKSEINKSESIQDFLRTLEDKYDFRLKDCSYMTSDEYILVKYKDGKEVIEDSEF